MIIKCNNPKESFHTSKKFVEVMKKLNSQKYKLVRIDFPNTTTKYIAAKKLTILRTYDNSFNVIEADEQNKIISCFKYVITPVSWKFFPYEFGYCLIILFFSGAVSIYSANEKCNFLSYGLITEEK